MWRWKLRDQNGAVVAWKQHLVRFVEGLGLPGSVVDASELTYAEDAFFSEKKVFLTNP